MRIEQLYYFVKVANLHSFSAASTETYLSQQALSTSIKNLEKEFRTEFFIRTPKGVVLTESGQYFYDIATQIMKLHEQLYNHFLIHPDKTDSIKIAINNNCKNYYFPKVITYFLKEHPTCQIQYIITDNDKVLQEVLNRNVDIGVLPVLHIDQEFLTQLPENITFSSLDATYYSLLTSIHSPLAHFKTISMSTVVKYPLVINTSADYSHNLFLNLIAHYSDHPNTTLVDSLGLQLQMVEDNLGNMLFLQRNPCPSNKYVKIPITNDISINTGFIHLTDAPLTSFQRLYLEKANNLIKKQFYQ